MQRIKIEKINIKWWVNALFFVTLFSIIIIFAYIKTDFLVKGIKIEAAIDLKNSSSLVEVKGNAQNSIYLSLNGREIFIDREGNFSELVKLLPGFSIISLEAKDQFGKTDKKQFKVVQKESAEAIALVN